MAFIQQAKNRIVGRGAGIVCMVASNDDTKMFIIDEDDFEIVRDITWRIKKGYMVAAVGNQMVSLHRFITNARDGFLIDHKNRNKLDNRRDNLRECNTAQNLSNRGKQNNNTSGYKGVSYCKNRRKWIAEINFTEDRLKNRLRKAFGTAVDAAHQYNEWARIHHGEFAVLNNV